LASSVNKGNVDKGFWDEAINAIQRYRNNPTPRNKAVRDAFVSQFLLLIQSEIGEACEAMRKDKYSSTVGINTVDGYVGSENERASFQNHVKDTFEDELADSLIRILDLAGGLGIDIQWHVDRKLAYNAGREAKHGKNF
jgi:NTP pyrophosphatase (non-canonical NTP hydrolase)